MSLFIIYLKSFISSYGYIKASAISDLSVYYTWKILQQRGRNNPVITIKTGLKQVHKLHEIYSDFTNNAQLFKMQGTKNSKNLKKQKRNKKLNKTKTAQKT